ncbi:hypothetical protein MMC27_003463 [Xylographa pallens]|nr:hypothetical protein [Xylographa pallens]
MVAKLVILGADIKIQDRQGLSALHHVIDCNTECGLDVANWLLRNDTDTRAQEFFRRTCVTFAVVLRRNRFLELLLARGAVYTMPDRFHCNVLFIAAAYGDLESLSILGQEGIALQNPNAEDTTGWTPMEMAQWRRDYNTKWADWAFVAPDEDPRKFFEAFEALYQSVEQRSSAMDWTTSADPGSATDVEEEADRHLPGSFPDD